MPRAGPWVRVAGWSFGLAVLVLGTLVWMSLTHAHPAFDAYGWLTWGRQTVGGSLNTGAAPSWKPLPYAFTLPFALFGGRQLWLWTFTASLLGLSGAIFAFRAAARLASASPPAPDWLTWPVVVSGLLGAGAYLSIYGLWRQLLITDTDPIVVVACLVALELQFARRPLGALAALTMAALGRPEAWPVLALDMAWVCLAAPAPRRRGRVLSAACLVLVPAAWFVIPGLTSKSPFQAGTAAIGFHTAILHGDRIPVVLVRFASLYDPAVWVVVIVAFLWALLRRQVQRLVIYALVAVWLATEIAFAFHDWPAAPRYVMEPAAILGVLSAGWIGRMLACVGAVVSARRPRSWALGLLAAVGAAALALTLIPFGVGRVGALEHDTIHEALVTRQMQGLTAAIALDGGYRHIDACAPALTPVGDESAVAWNLHENIGVIAHRPGPELRHGLAAVYLRPHGAGPTPAHWTISTVNLSHAARRRCQGVPASAVGRSVGHAETIRGRQARRSTRIREESPGQRASHRARRHLAVTS